MKFATILAFACVSTAIKISDREDDNDALDKATSPIINFLQKGTGSECKEGQEAAVQYTGSLVRNGMVFDSSIPRGEAFKFTIGEFHVIKCWEQAIVQLHVGDKANVSCPSSLAYGEQAMGDVIPANSNLMFEIQVESCQE